MKRLYVALVALGLAAAAAAGVARAAEPLGGSTALAGWTPVTSTVDFPWDGITPETVVTSTLDGCDAGDVVVTANDPDRLIGSLWIFSGTKTFSCDAGQLTIAYRAYRIGDATSSFGTWSVVDGTGLYAGMNGIGVVKGRYTYDGTGQKTGMVDSYVGLVRLAT